MKTKLKKVLLTFLTLLFIACAATLSACENRTVIEKKISIYFKNGESVRTINVDITSFSDKSTIYDLLVSKQKKAILKAKIANKETDMAYLDGIYGMDANANNYEYMAIYSSLSSFTEDTSFTVKVSGIDFYFSNVGIKKLLIVENANYLFSLEQWTTHEAVALATAKTNAILELDTYVNAENYRATEKITLADAISDGKTAIENATDVNSVQTSLANAKTVIDKIKTDEQLTAEEIALALTTSKTNAKLELDSYANAENYRAAEKITLADAISDGKTAIENATDINSVQTSLANAKSKIDEIKTDAELFTEEILASAKTNALVEINNYKNLPENTVTGFPAATQTFETIYKKLDKSINNALTVEAVQTAVSDAKKTIDGLIVTVYCTFSDNGEFMFTKDNTAIAQMKVNVPYFDLEYYDLSDFWRYESDTFENGGSYIGSEVLLQPTVMHTFIYLHVLYAENGIDDLEITGSSCSSYMVKFWGLDQNLNYYIDYSYPLMAKGWGSTSDYILLEDEMNIDLAHWTDYSFISIGAKFIFADNNKINVTVGEKTDFVLNYNLFDWSTYEGVVTPAEIDWLTGTGYAEGEDLHVKAGFSDITDTDGDGILDYTFDTAGTYYIVFRDPGVVNGSEIEYYTVPYIFEIVVE